MLLHSLSCHDSSNGRDFVATTGETWAVPSVNDDDLTIANETEGASTEVAAGNDDDISASGDEEQTDETGADNQTDSTGTDDTSDDTVNETDDCFVEGSYQPSCFVDEGIADPGPDSVTPCATSCPCDRLLRLPPASTSSVALPEWFDLVLDRGPRTVYVHGLTNSLVSLMNVGGMVVATRFETENYRYVDSLSWFGLDSRISNEITPYMGVSASDAFVFQRFTENGLELAECDPLRILSTDETPCAIRRIDVPGSLRAFVNFENFIMHVSGGSGLLRFVQGGIARPITDDEFACSSQDELFARSRAWRIVAPPQSDTACDATPLARSSVVYDGCGHRQVLDIPGACDTVVEAGSTDGRYFVGSSLCFDTDNTPRHIGWVYDGQMFRRLDVHTSGYSVFPGGVNSNGYIVGTYIEKQRIGDAWYSRYESRPWLAEFANLFLLKVKMSDE